MSLVTRKTFYAIMGLLSFLFGSSSKAQSQSPKMNPADAGKSLRHMMLTTPIEKLGEKPTTEFPRIYGILIDWPIGDQIATIFSSSQGAASLYTTSTFGIIGGEGHEPVRRTAKNLVRAADRYFDESKPTKEFPYPDNNHVRFYFLTFSGVRTIEADLGAINKGTGQHAALFGLGQDVLTELRLVTEKQK